MQQVAALFPLKWMAQGMRSVFLPDWATADGGRPARGSSDDGRRPGVWLVVGLVRALRTFRWRRRDAG